MRVVDAGGRTIRDINPMVMSALYQIESLTPEGRDVRVRTAAGANDPMLLLRSQWVTPRPRWNAMQFVTPFSLGWIAAAAAGLLAVAMGLMVRDVKAGPVTVHDALWLAAVLLIVIAAKLTLLRLYPMPVPFWDQWDGEVSNLYLPYFNGGLTWRQMFTLHNEHRIFFTRVLALVLLAVNGQWDPQLQIVVNIGLHALTAVVLTASLWLAAGRRWLAWIAITVMLAIAPPFALENTLAGFQSGFYFLVLFSALALWLMSAHRPGTGSWIVGWACALAAVVTVAGGILTVLAVGVTTGVAWLARPRAWRPWAATAAALAGVGAIGYAVMSPPLPYHDYLKAEHVPRVQGRVRARPGLPVGADATDLGAHVAALDRARRHDGADAIQDRLLGTLPARAWRVGRGASGGSRVFARRERGGPGVAVSRPAQFRLPGEHSGADCHRCLPAPATMDADGGMGGGHAVGRRGSGGD